MSTNKLGVQVIGDRYDPALLAGAHGLPRVTKLVDPSLLYYQRVRAVVGPMGLVVIRWAAENQPLDNPVQRAREWFDLHRAFILAAMSDATLFEGYNEIADSAAPAYVAFELERIRLLHLVGAWACIGNWSVGVPELALWTLVYKPLVAACIGKDALGFHEYWADTADIANTWHCGRWRMVPSLTGKRKIITECGRDYLPDTKQGKPGYQLSCSDEVMVGDLLQYATIADKYLEVLGITAFQTGSIDSKWRSFELKSLWPQVTAQYAQEVIPVPTVITHPPMTIDGGMLKASEFALYAESLNLKSKYDRVYIHHTASPDEATWDKWGGWEYWKKALVRFYATKEWYDAQGVKHIGWDSGPHLFVDQVGMGLFWDLAQDGTGVYANNTRTRHIEIVGNFTSHLPEGERLANAVTAAAALLKAGGLGLEALSYHRASEPDTDCPGAKLIENWNWFKGLVAAQLAAWAEPTRAEIEAAIGAEMQQHIIPLNPEAALEKTAAAMGLLPAGGEFDLSIGGKPYRCQAFRKAEERESQYGLYCLVGDWGNVQSFKRAN